MRTLLFILLASPAAANPSPDVQALIERADAVTCELFNLEPDEPTCRALEMARDGAIKSENKETLSLFLKLFSTESPAYRQEFGTRL